MYKNELSRLKELLTCPSCDDIAQVPFESSCCKKIFCKKCVRDMGHFNCPYIKNKKMKFSRNFLASKIIENLYFLKEEDEKERETVSTNDSMY